MMAIAGYQFGKRVATARLYRPKRHGDQAVSRRSGAGVFYIALYPFHIASQSCAHARDARPVSPAAEAAPNGGG